MHQSAPTVQFAHAIQQLVSIATVNTNDKTTTAMALKRAHLLANVT